MKEAQNYLIFTDNLLLHKKNHRMILKVSVWLSQSSNIRFVAEAAQPQLPPLGLLEALIDVTVQSVLYYVSSTMFFFSR